VLSVGGPLTRRGGLAGSRLNKERIGQLCELSKGRWRSFTLKGTGHHNWNDFCFYAPIVSRYAWHSQPPPPTRASRLTCARAPSHRLVGLTRERDLTEAHDDTMALVDAFLADVLTDEQDATGDELPRLDRAVSAILRENPSHEDAVLEVDAAPGRHRNDPIASTQQQ